MQKQILFFTLIILISGSFTVLPSDWFTTSLDGDFIVTEAQGQGRTLSEAKINARRNAAQQAIGFFVNGMSTYENGKNFKESIIRLSRAIIGDNEEELSHSENNGRHKVTLRVKVRGELLKGLLREDFSKSAIDGLSLVAHAQRREKWEKEVSDTLLEVIGTFPVSKYINIKVSANENAFDVKNEKLDTSISIDFDRAGYFTEAVPSLTAVLDYVANAVVKDIPFLFTVEQKKNGNETFYVITPPTNLNDLSQYSKLMDIVSKNRYINSEDGGFANIYILTDDYYFNAYRIAPSAFIQLIEGFFIEKINA